MTIWIHKDDGKTAVVVPDGSVVEVDAKGDVHVTPPDAGSAAEAAATDRSGFGRTLVGHKAPIHTLAFGHEGRRLWSAAEDATVLAWDLDWLRPGRPALQPVSGDGWPAMLARPGTVDALAVAPDDGLLAVAGPWKDSPGSVRLYRPDSGALVAAFDDHATRISSLGFSSDGRWIASLDKAGKAVLRRRDLAEPPVLMCGSDASQYGSESAALIASRVQRRPMVILKDTDVVLPHYWGKGADGQTVWQLKWISVADPKDLGILDVRHTGMITALAGGRDGRYLAWADRDRRLFIWDVKQRKEPSKLVCEAVVRSLCFGPDGRTLVAGTDVLPGQSEGRVQTWDLWAKGVYEPRRTSGAVTACAVSPDGRWLAYAVGAKANVVPLNQPEPQSNRSARGPLG